MRCGGQGNDGYQADYDGHERHRLRAVHGDPPDSDLQSRDAREDRDPCAAVPQQQVDSDCHEKHEWQDGKERNVSLDARDVRPTGDARDQQPQ
jgi:hypothetical protein